MFVNDRAFQYILHMSDATMRSILPHKKMVNLTQYSICSKAIWCGVSYILSTRYGQFFLNIDTDKQLPAK